MGGLVGCGWQAKGRPMPHMRPGAANIRELIFRCYASLHWI